MQPVTGFHVDSVHSMPEPSAMGVMLVWFGSRGDEGRRGSETQRSLSNALDWTVDRHAPLLAFWWSTFPHFSADSIAYYLNKCIVYGQSALRRDSREPNGIRTGTVLADG